MKKKQNLFETLSDLISESDLVTEIKQLRIFSQQNKSVSSMKTLKDRISNDIKIIYQKTHMAGFYSAVAKYDIDTTNSERVKVKIDVDLGKKFKLKLNLNYFNRDADFQKRHSLLLEKDLQMFKASVDEIVFFIKIALKNLQKEGFFSPKIIEKKVWIDYEKKEAILNLTIDPGQKVFFSEAKIKAFPDIDEQFIRNRIIWKKGEEFDIEKVESTAENLKNTQIFAKVKVKPDSNSIVDDKIPMIIELSEEKKHMIDIGLLYSGMRSMNFEKRSEAQKKLKSIIARLTWTNCNAFGGGEKLSFAIEGTPMKIQDRRSDYAFETSLSQPDMIFRNNTVTYCVSKRQDLTNTFFKKNDNLSVMFEYPLKEDLLLRTGGNIEKNYVDADEIFFRDGAGKRYNNLLIPIELVFDRTNDLLNPTSGYRISMKFSEVFLKSAKLNNISTFDVCFSYNYAFDDLKKTIFAFNVARKSIIVGKIDDIPLDKRIYAGGMNSTRGFASQMATDMILGVDAPMGGKSSLEFNNEIRRRISEDFALVLLFDGAKVFQNISRFDYLQTEKKRWFFSTGIGIRYYTRIGPIRVDFAFPMRKRKGIDSKMQFVMSLGQAF
ncbi:MAG: BamA/TamA family outer membrane protein [Holosporaceae bacterium]|nr:BamA/TamA family outer membrane protein [Holosporaceae bacterium]